MSVCYLLQMTVSSASEWKGSAEHQQEAEHCTAVNGTSSNTSFSHLKDGPQKNVEMFMLRYILEFLGNFTLLSDFSFGTTFLQRLYSFTQAQLLLHTVLRYRSAVLSWTFISCLTKLFLNIAYT